MRQKKIEELELIEFINNTGQHRVVDSVAEGFEIGQLGFFISIFGFFTSDAGKKLLMMKPLIDFQPLQVYLFPLAAVLEIGEASTALYKLMKADNKNLDKTLEFSSKATKASIISTAVAMGVYAQVTGAVALGVAVPYLFVAAIALNTLYSAGAAIYHAVGMMRTSKGSALYEAHQQALIKNIVKTIAGAVLAGAIVALLVLGISTPVGLAVVSGIAILTLVAVFAISRVMKHRANKSAELARQRRQKKSTERKMEERFTAVFQKNASNEAVEVATRAEGKEDDRLYVRNLSHLLNEAKREGHEALKNAFINVIDAKIAKLRNQIQKETTSLRLFSETPKRNAKIDGLTGLHQKIEGLGKDAYLHREEIDDISGRYKKIFQSFLHDKSDVELIFDAAKEYFAFIPASEPLAQKIGF